MPAPGNRRGRIAGGAGLSAHPGDASADWPEVRRIYTEGIATGDATLERTAPDWDHFDRSHRDDCRFVARETAAEAALGWVVGRA